MKERKRGKSRQLLDKNEEKEPSVKKRGTSYGDKQTLTRSFWNMRSAELMAGEKRGGMLEMQKPLLPSETKRGRISLGSE